MGSQADIKEPFFFAFDILHLSFIHMGMVLGLNIVLNKLGKSFTNHRICKSSISLLF